MKDYLAVTKALSDASRTRMLCALRGGELCVCQLIELLQLAPSTVSHHIKELRQVGLIRVERRGQNIHCWIDADVVRSLADFFQCSWAACSDSDEAAA